MADEGLSQGTETPFFCPKMGQALGTATLKGSLHLTFKSLLLEPALCCSFPFFLLPSLPYWFLLGDPTPDRPLCRAAAPSRLCPEVGQRVSPPTCGFPSRGGSGPPRLTICLAPVAWSAQPCCRKWKIWFLTLHWLALDKVPLLCLPSPHEGTDRHGSIASGRFEVLGQAPFLDTGVHHEQVGVLLI